MHIHITHSLTLRDTADPHLTIVNILHPHPYCTDTHTLQTLQERPTHDRMHSRALTHEHITKVKGPFRPSPDFRAHISHQRCGEHAPAFTHPQACCIHPNTHT